MKSFGLYPMSDGSIVNKEFYIDGFLIGFTECLKNSKISSLKEIEHLIQILNQDLIKK